MIRCKFALATLMTLGLCVSLANSQDAQPQSKDKKGPATPTINQLLEPDTYKDDLKTVREGGLKGDAADLLEYFRKRAEAAGPQTGRRTRQAARRRGIHRARESVRRGCSGWRRAAAAELEIKARRIPTLRFASAWPT